jgi:hypothetical protein
MPSQKKSGALWLILALVSLFVTLGVGGFGLYAISHTHANVKRHEKMLLLDEAELDLVRNRKIGPKNNAKIAEAQQNVEVTRMALRNYYSDRTGAIIIALSALLPAILTAIFFVIYLLKRQSRVASDNRDEDDHFGDRRRRGEVEPDRERDVSPRRRSRGTDE